VDAYLLVWVSLLSLKLILRNDSFGIFSFGVAYQVVLHGVVNMQLPNQWLWDMVDEFVYQFQSFCQYRAKMKNKTEQEIALLRQYDQVIVIGKHYDSQDFPNLHVFCSFSDTSLHQLLNWEEFHSPVHFFK